MKGFLARTKLAREAAGYSQGTLANALGLERGIYAKYETRSLLPHHLVGRFVELTGVNYNYLFKGTAVKHQDLQGPDESALRTA